MSPFDWRWRGRLPYAQALEEMRATWERRRRGEVPDTLWLLEHPPVLTVGRSGAVDDVLATPADLARAGIELHHVDRGGRVTYHGPGQLVGYPIFEVGAGPPDAARFVRRLGRVLEELLAGYGLAARWDEERPGVWVGGAKLGAVGVRVEGGVSRHGFALNVDPELAHFGLIIPCGITGHPVSSLAELLGRRTAVEEVARRVPEVFGTVFGQTPRAIIPTGK